MLKWGLFVMWATPIVGIGAMAVVFYVNEWRERRRREKLRRWNVDRIREFESQVRL